MWSERAASGDSSLPRAWGAEFSSEHHCVWKGSELPAVSGAIWKEREGVKFIWIPWVIPHGFLFFQSGAQRDSGSGEELIFHSESVEQSAFLPTVYFYHCMLWILTIAWLLFSDGATTTGCTFLWANTPEEHRGRGRGLGTAGCKGPSATCSTAHRLSPPLNIETGN